LQQPQSPRTDLWIDLFRHELILPDSEGSGIKPGVIHLAVVGVSAVAFTAVGILEILAALDSPATLMALFGSTA
ncbi:hypothetical protein, partial [Gordonia hongkongensis]|uniref:hypothetical protein n=1 Tax=Gordonia hongkongensis TaxID=1701090 RepID=UPI003D0D996F